MQEAGLDTQVTKCLFTDDVYCSTGAGTVSPFSLIFVSGCWVSLLLLTCMHNIHHCLRNPHAELVHFVFLPGWLFFCSLSRMSLWLFSVPCVVVSTCTVLQSGFASHTLYTVCLLQGIRLCVAIHHHSSCIGRCCHLLDVFGMPSSGVVYALDSLQQRDWNPLQFPSTVIQTVQESCRIQGVILMSY